MNSVSHHAEQQQLNRLEIRTHSGRSAFVTAGKPVPGLIAIVLPTSGEHEIRAAANAGVRIFLLREYDVPFTENLEALVDFLKRAVSPLRKIAPDAQVILEWNCEPSTDWLASNGNEAAVCPGSRDALVSWASVRWLRAAEAVISRLVTTNSDHSLTGIVISTGTGGWGLSCDPRLRDTSRSMTDRLKLLARDRYRRNVSLLRNAWNEPTLDFHTLRCPRLVERKSEANLVFARAGVTDNALADYWDAVNSAINDALLSLASAVKAASPRTLVGANCAALYAGAPTPGGIAEPLMDSNAIDFFVGPTEGCNAVVRLLTGSLTLRNKMMVQQELSLTASAAALTSVHQSGLIVPLGPTAQEWTRALTLMKLPTVREAARACAAAVLLDSSALRTTTQSEAARHLHDVSCSELVREAAMSGLSFDVYHFSDIYRKDFPLHALTLAANLYYLSDSDRQKLDARLKNRDQTIVWFWGVGLQGENGASADNVARLTGMKIKRDEGECGLQVRVVACKDNILNSLKEGDRLGAPLSVSPTFTVIDRTALRAGINASGKTGMAINRNASWTSIAVMTPVVTGALIRSIGAASGRMSLWSGIHHEPVMRCAGSRLAVFNGQVAGTLNTGGRDTWVTSDGREIEGAQTIKPGTVFAALLKAPKAQ